MPVSLWSTDTSLKSRVILLPFSKFFTLPLHDIFTSSELYDFTEADIVSALLFFVSRDSFTSVEAISVPMLETTILIVSSHTSPFLP